jgi:hypothetical protein
MTPTCVSDHEVCGRGALLPWPDAAVSARTEASASSPTDAAILTGRCQTIREEAGASLAVLTLPAFRSATDSPNRIKP